MHKKEYSLIAKYDVLIPTFLDRPDINVTKEGKILSKRDRRGKVCETYREIGSKNSNGYWTVSVKYKGVSVNVLRSRIVFFFFNKNLDKTLVINHIDGNKSNDAPSNLELVTQSYNNKHRFAFLGHKPVIGNFKINKEIAEQIRHDKKSGLTLRELKEKYNLSKTTCSYIINNKIWK